MDGWMGLTSEERVAQVVFAVLVGFDVVPFEGVAAAAKRGLGS